MTGTNLDLLKDVNTVVADTIELGVEREDVFAKVAGMSDEAISVVMQAGDVPAAYAATTPEQKAELSADFAEKFDIPNDADEAYVEALYPALVQIVFATARRLKARKDAQAQN